MQVFGLFKGPTLNRCRAKSDQQNLCVRDQKQSGSENGHVKLGSEGSDCIFFLMIFSKLFAKPPHKIGKSSTAQSFTFFKSKIKNIVRVGRMQSSSMGIFQYESRPSRHVQDEGPNHSVPPRRTIGEKRKLSALTGYSSAVQVTPWQL